MHHPPAGFLGSVLLGGDGVAFVDSANLVVEDGADQITRNMATMIRPAVLLMSTPEMASQGWPLRCSCCASRPMTSMLPMTKATTKVERPVVVML